MKDKRTILRLTVLAVIFFALGSAFYTSYTSGDGKLAIGDQVPDFQLQSIEGETVRLSDYKGKAIFINFWARWCEPCKVEMPIMEEYYQEMADEDFEILAINIAESEVPVSAFTNRLGLTYPILLDSDRAVTNQYQVGNLPASFFIDADGRLVDTHEGPLNREMLESYMNKILPSKQKN